MLTENKGDVVRISRSKGQFEKEYKQNFMDEYFTISEQIPRDPWYINYKTMMEKN